MTNISYGKAKLKDALAISVLFKTIYIETYAEAGVTGELARFITKRFSPEYIGQIIQENRDQLIIAYCNQNPIGAARIIFEDTCPIRNITMPLLDKLYVLQRFYGKGVGLGLLKEVEKEIRRMGSDEMRLEVYIENGRAISFYKKHEFKEIGEVDFLEENSTYRNKVMTKRLN